jgi:hypothetical protein
MKSGSSSNACLTRRGWLVLTASALSACGGGSGSGSTTTSSLPGTGGTGIYAQGSIWGFGSVRVNGIKFDDTAATVEIDGQTGKSSDLRLGMVAGIQGLRGADATLAIANSIEVWSIAQGPVASSLPGQFTLAGMTLQTDSGTVFDGIAGAAALTPGLTVRVWGLQAAADGSRWTATRVAVVNATSIVSTGLVTSSGSQRFVNGLRITGTAVAGLTVGDLARVQGTLSSTGASLEVISVKVLVANGGPPQQGEAEIEGLVTAVLSTTRFTMGTVEVDATNAAFSPAGAKITLGARLEAEGIWQNRVLKATKVEIEDSASAQEIEIEAPIEAYTDLSNFVVRGQRCDATLALFTKGTAADLKVGVQVKLRGVVTGSVLMVSRIEVDK